MKWLIKTGIIIFWTMDILNMPFMEMFDTTYPLNGWFWALVIVLTSIFGEEKR